MLRLESGHQSSVSSLFLGIMERAATAPRVHSIYAVSPGKFLCAELATLTLPSGLCGRSRATIWLAGDQMQLPRLAPRGYS